MAQISGISGIWILDEISRITIVQRIYQEKVKKDNLVQTLYSTILSFSYDGLEEKRSGTILMGNQRIVYEKAQNLFFVVVVEENYDIMDVKRILSHLRVTFLRKYPIRDYSWQSDEYNRHFEDFEKTIDEIVKHFGETLVVAKIVLMGLDFAGKTTLAHSFANSKLRDYLPTKGLDILKIEYNNMLLRIWDLGGQRQFWKLWPKFAAEASGIIFVVDSTTNRWSETKEAFEVSKLLNIPYVIFANKQDIIDEAESIEGIAERLDVPINTIIAGSALLDEGALATLDRLTEIIQSVDLEEESKEKKEGKTGKLVNINQIHEIGLRFLQELENRGWVLSNTILLEFRRLLGYTNLLILRSDQNSGEFHIIACEGEDCKLLKESFPAQSSQGVLHHVLAQKEPMIISEITNNSQEIFVEELKKRLLSSLVFPITDSVNDWGVCLAFSNVKGYPEQKHVELFLIFAQYLAMGFKYLSRTN